MQKYFDEIKVLLVSLIPLAFMSAFNLGKSVTDVLMVGNLDKNNLAGLSLAVNIYMFVIMFIAGISPTVTSVLSRYYAKNNLEGIKKHSQQNLYFHLGFASLIFLLFINSHFLFENLNVQESTKEISYNYLVILGFTFPLVCLKFVFHAIAITFKENKMLFYIGVAGFFLNIPLNYILIYGKLGFPEMGAIGCAYATAFCNVGEVLLIIGFCYFKDHMNIFTKFPKVDFKIIKDIIYLGVPSSLASLSEHLGYMIILFLIVKYGESAISGHQIACTIVPFLFIISQVLNVTLNQRVSFHIGGQNYERIKSTVICGLCIVTFFSIFTIVLTFIFAEDMVSLYTKDSQIIEIGTAFLLTTIFYQTAGGISLAEQGVFRAFKENKYLFKLVTFCFWFVGLPVGFYLSQSLGVYAYWWSFVAFDIAASILGSIKVYQLVWGNYEKRPGDAKAC